jgi:phosphoribosylformylglycinamidine synthase
MLRPLYDENGVVVFDDLKKLFDYVHSLASAGKILTARSIGFGGAFDEVFKAAIGNKIGVNFLTDDVKALFTNCYGGFIIETDEDIKGELIAHTTSDAAFTLCGTSMNLEKLIAEWEKPLEKVFPINTAWMC